MVHRAEGKSIKGIEHGAEGKGIEQGDLKLEYLFFVICLLISGCEVGSVGIGRSA